METQCAPVFDSKLPTDLLGFPVNLRMKSNEALDVDKKLKREKWFFRLVQNSLKNKFYFITSMPYQYAYGSIWSYCQMVPGMTTAWNQTKLSMLRRNRNGGSDFFRLVLSTKQPYKNNSLSQYLRKKKYLNPKQATGRRRGPRLFVMQ